MSAYVIARELAENIVKADAKETVLNVEESFSQYVQKLESPLITLVT